MPTYEYVCTECGNPLEVVQSIHEPSLTECPQCQGRLRKVFGNVGVVFKGSGFYRTDSRAKSSGKTARHPGCGEGTRDGTQDVGEVDQRARHYRRRRYEEHDRHGREVRLTDPGSA